MKNVGLGSALTLFLLSLATAPATHAQTPGQSASGIFRFLLEDDLLKSVDFDVRTDEKGFASGPLTLTDEATIPDFDDPEAPREGDPPKGFTIKAQIDSLTIEKNQALMNGVVLDSSHTNYIGKWVQLVVEDNRDNRELPDRLTWSFCKRGEGGWIPSDAEWDGKDDGAFLRWWATDAERKDDVGIPSPNLIPGEDRSCPVHALAVYPFADALRWDGDIVVQP
jgi:hypothetical protein